MMPAWRLRVYSTCERRAIASRAIHVGSPTPQTLRPPPGSKLSRTEPITVCRPLLVFIDMVFQESDRIISALKHVAECSPRFHPAADQSRHAANVLMTRGPRPAAPTPVGSRDSRDSRLQPLNLVGIML